MRAEQPLVISGNAVVGEDLILTPVTITIEHGRITAVEESVKVPDIWICPAFFNAHTHLGDTIAMDCAVSGDLVSMVTPPDGIKHKYLDAASPSELVAGMRESIRLMSDRGAAGCADFREGGPAGVAALKSAAAGQTFRALIFGRDGGEYAADGIGISSARDIRTAACAVEGAKKAGKLVAFHAGEKDVHDIDTALSYEPDLIIHATHATDAQLRQCAEKEIPIAVCPQSNWILDVAHSRHQPPVQRMLDLGCRVFLGTDNVMFVQPDMTAAMAFVHTIYHIDPADILRMAVGGSSLSGEPYYISQGARANFITLNPRNSNLVFSKDPVASIVKRGFSICSSNKVFNL